MFSGIVTIMLCCFGQLSMKKAQGLLLMSLVVTVVNLINLLVLEFVKRRSVGGLVRVCIE